MYQLVTPELLASVVYCICCADPYGKPVLWRLSQVGSRQRVEFEPVDVGPHTVDVHYAGQPVHSSPYTANVYDVGRVRLVDAPSSGVLGNDVQFTGQCVPTFTRWRYESPLYLVVDR